MPEIRVEYPTYGSTSAVIPENHGRARAGDGASVLGYSFVPESRASVLRIIVQINAFSVEKNRLVMALFRQNNVKPIKITSKKIKANTRVQITMAADVPAGSTAPAAFDVRVGPAQPGTIYLNGDDQGAQPVDPVPFLTIEEIG